MKRIVALICSLCMCLSLCACGKSKATKEAEAAIASIGEVSLDSSGAISQAQKLYELLTDAEKSKVSNRSVLADAQETYDNLVYTHDAEEIKNVYATLKGVYEIIDHHGSDLYTAWQKGIYQKDKFQGANLNNATNYLASQLFLDYDEVLDGECYAWYFLFGEDWETVSEEQLQKDRETFATGTLFYMCKDKKSACIITVIGAYRVNGDVERVNAAFEKYNALERSIRENERFSQEVETLDKLYTTMKSFLGFCQDPTGSFNQVGDTMSQYRKDVQECMTTLDRLLNQ